MKAWMQKHFTVGGIATLITMFITFLTVVGAVFIFADDVKEDARELKVHKKDGHPATVIKMVDEQKIVLSQLKSDVDKKLNTEVFEAYQISQKELDSQFQKQLFQQLDRLEQKIN